MKMNRMEEYEENFVYEFFKENKTKNNNFRPARKSQNQIGSRKANFY